MVALETPEVQTGWPAADFSLKATDGKIYSLNDVKGPNGLVVMFICNHCPYVQAILDRLLIDIKQLQENGVGVVAIMSNDTETYPDDNLENMTKLSQEKNFSFPYLIDETQAVAKEYDAVCTPDFYGFNDALELQYRGRFDDAGMNKDHHNPEHDLLNAMMQIAQMGRGPRVQNPSIGCSIKWKNA